MAAGTLEDTTQSVPAQRLLSLALSQRLCDLGSGGFRREIKQGSLRGHNPNSLDDPYLIVREVSRLVTMNREGELRAQLDWNSCTPVGTTGPDHLDRQAIPNQTMMGESAAMREATAFTTRMDCGPSSTNLVRSTSRQTENVAKDRNQQAGLLPPMNHLLREADVPKFTARDHPMAFFNRPPESSVQFG